MPGIDDFLKSVETGAGSKSAPKEKRAKRLPKCRDCGKRFDTTGGYPRRRLARCEPCRGQRAAQKDAERAAYQAEMEAREREAREERESRWLDRCPGPLSHDELLVVGALLEAVRSSGYGRPSPELSESVDAFGDFLTAETLSRRDFLGAGALLERLRQSNRGKAAVSELRLALLAVHGGAGGRWDPERQ